MTNWTGNWTINHRRMEIISALNRGFDEFPELKKEIFYYENDLKCATTKKKEMRIRCILCGYEKTYKTKNKESCPIRTTHNWRVVKK